MLPKEHKTATNSGKYLEKLFSFIDEDPHFAEEAEKEKIKFFGRERGWKIGAKIGLGNLKNDVKIRQGFAFLHKFCNFALQNYNINILLHLEDTLLGYFLPARIVCIEVKMADKWQRKWERPMRSLANDSRIYVDKIVGVYTSNRRYHYDNIDVLPIIDFLKLLHRGDIF